MFKNISVVLEKYPEKNININILNYFYIFLSLAIIFSILLIFFLNNPIHAIITLILIFINVGIFFIFLNADFFAFLFFIVYIGAIAVLFLFIIMMLNVKIDKIKEIVLKYLPLFLFVFIIFILELFFVVKDNYLIFSEIKNNNILILSAIFKYRIVGAFDVLWEIENWDINNYFLNIPWANINYINYFENQYYLSNIESIGVLLYTYFFYLFFLCSIILLIAMLGAITLTLNPINILKNQDYFFQNIKKMENSIILKKNKTKKADYWEPYTKIEYKYFLDFYFYKKIDVKYPIWYD